jgi:hypothetical protein
MPLEDAQYPSAGNNMPGARTYEVGTTLAPHSAVLNMMHGNTCSKHA